MSTSPADSTQVRLEVAEKLLKAIRIAEEIAEGAEKAPKGGGAVPPKVRWYQIMGYLAQTLNGVLRNADLNQTKHDITELQKMVVEIEERTRKTKAANRPAPGKTKPVPGPQ